jgi:hypothetical protein
MMRPSKAITNRSLTVAALMVADRIEHTLASSVIFHYHPTVRASGERGDPTKTTYREDSAA